MDAEQFSLQPLDQWQLEILVEWAAAEGWNPGPHDAAAFYATDPDGYYGFFHEQRLIAGGAIVSYERLFGFMGLFIVHPDYRGRGLGQRLWHLRRDALLQRLQPGAAIGMDGVVAMQPFYQAGGFELAFTSNRYECRARALPVSSAVSLITRTDWPEIFSYDEIAVGYRRSSFLTAWLQLPDSRAFQLRRHGLLHGYAVLRKVAAGYKIGPLFCDSPEGAETLYRCCLNAAVSQTEADRSTENAASVYLDVPCVNQDALDMVGRYEPRYVFECGRMYYGTPPPQQLQNVYGVTTFELG
ncbi:MAG: GNAT family N-acetyltransferase [Planctomycetaceae bacterium]|nr:GNAT family N-acetyltransferase [Planctomycetaceae bacterium]